MSKTALTGKRYVNLLRASTDKQDTSPDQQKQANDYWAAKQGMIWAGDIELLGVSGAKTFNRRDLKGLLEQRRLRKDYDVLVVYDSSRLTRGGSAHGSSIRRDFAKEGVLVQSVIDPVPEGDFKETMQSIIDTQNLLFVKRLSAYVTRGMLSAIRDGTIDTFGGGPLGTEIQYIGVDGKPVARIRKLPGGARQLFDERTKEVIVTYGRGEHPGSARLMIAGEKSRLVMGDPATVNVIREVFRLRYIDKVGYNRISKFLTASTLKPSRAQYWCEASVRQMVLNPTYLGFGYAMKTAGGLFNGVSLEGPEARDINQDELEALGRESVPRDRRPLAKMLRVEFPALAGFIVDPAVRAAAEATIRKYHETWHVSTRPANFLGSSSKPMSKYFLRGLMRDYHYKRPFKGLTSGKNSDFRYYTVRPTSDSKNRPIPLRWSVRADAIEAAVLDVLKHAIAGVESISKKIEQYVVEMLREQPTERDRAALEKEDEALKQRIRMITSALNGRDLSDIESTLRSLSEQRNQIGKRLSSIRSTFNVAETKKLVADLRSELMNFNGPATLTADDSGAYSVYERLSCVVAALCPKITMNLETYETEIVVAFPKQAFACGPAGWRDMCQQVKQEHLSQRLAHPSNWLEIGVYRLNPILTPHPMAMGIHPPCCTGFKWHQVSPKPQSRRRPAA